MQRDVPRRWHAATWKTTLLKVSVRSSKLPCVLGPALGGAMWRYGALLRFKASDCQLGFMLTRQEGEGCISSNVVLKVVD